jgi:uncharacterized membrane protein
MEGKSSVTYAPVSITMAVATLGVTVACIVAGAVVVIIVTSRRSRAYPAINRATMAIMIHHCVNPVNRAAVAVISDAGLLAVMICLSRINRS